MAYTKTIIGRHEEQDILRTCVASDKAEFIAVYGRRRVGKTFFIRQVVGKNAVFSFINCFSVYGLHFIKETKPFL